MNIPDHSLILIDESIINIDLLTTTKVGSTLFQLGMNNNHTKWFIMTSQIEYTRYFHVNFQSGELILLRPIEELINYTMTIELHVNVTQDWIDMKTIRVNIFLCSILNDLFYSFRLLFILKMINLDSFIFLKQIIIVPYQKQFQLILK
jgi:hypothetical protein